MTFFAAKPLGNQVVQPMVLPPQVMQPQVLYTPRQPTPNRHGTPNRQAAPNKAYPNAERHGTPNRQAAPNMGYARALAMQMPSVPLDDSLNKYCNEFSYEELVEATQNFKPSARLGKGANGSVFRGIMHDGQEVAVKAIELAEDTAGFDAEVRTLSKFRHPNLVCLIGFARNGPRRFLVYELLSGGDLRKRIEQSVSGDQIFSWKQRLSAAFDAACGLSHMHSIQPRAFHRDIKSANILLTKDGNAKMADFGLACRSSGTTCLCPLASGTKGYACPHYVQTLMVTERCEVYSFGMVLFELLTAESPCLIYESPTGETHDVYLVNKINRNPDVALSMVDRSASWPKTVAHAITMLALHCTHDFESMRPTFKDVVQELRSLCSQAEDVPECHPAVDKLRTTRPDAKAPRSIRAEAIKDSDEIRNHLSFASQNVSQADEDELGLTATTAPGTQSQAKPVAWKLECIDVKPSAAHLSSMGSAERVLMPGKEDKTFKVGRQFQNDFFARLLPVAVGYDKNVISRRHFEIWNLSDTQTSSASKVLLFNVSAAGTCVNGKSYYTAEGDHAELHDGDLITIPADGKDQEQQACFRFSILAEPCNADVEKFRVELKPNQYFLANSKLTRTSPLCGEPLAGINCSPFFVLEASGRSVKLDVSEPLRSLVHGPAFLGGKFAPLQVGRFRQESVWRRLIDAASIMMLSREHFTIGCRNSSPPREFYIENSSSSNPIRVLRPEGTIVFEKNQQELLRDSDEIHVVLSRDNSAVLLAFRFRITHAGLHGQF